MVQEKVNLKNISIAQKLKNRIFGQDHIVDNVIDTLNISFAGLSDPLKPIASFLFTGPTGVGKTELTKELAKALNMNFIRFDMSEYSDKYSARNLTGGSAGLVGYEEGGLLTNEVIDEPKSIVLFDEIEKADKIVLNTLLQVLDYGTLTDTKGNKADFTKTIIIMTSNLGAHESNGIGFGNSAINREKAVVNFLTPELRNRIDKILEFNQLSIEDADKIVEKYIDDLRQTLKIKRIELFISPKAQEYLTKTGFQSSMGARSVIRAINNEFKAQISKAILYSKDKLSKVQIDYEDEKFLFNFEYGYANFKKEIDESGMLYFEKAEDAHLYAKTHKGIIITRAADRVGFIAKKIEQKTLF